MRILVGGKCILDFTIDVNWLIVGRFSQQPSKRLDQISRITESSLNVNKLFSFPLQLVDVFKCLSNIMVDVVKAGMVVSIIK